MNKAVLSSNSPCEDVRCHSKANAEGCQGGLGFLIYGSQANHQDQKQGHDYLSNDSRRDLVIRHDGGESCPRGIVIPFPRTHHLQQRSAELVLKPVLRFKVLIIIFKARYGLEAKCI